MLQQEAMIARTRNVCREDERLAAAMMYGSFAQGTARLDREELRQAYASAWEWGRELMASLGKWHGVVPPAPLLERLDLRFSETFGGPEGP